MKKKTRVLCVCARGRNRSRYLAKYLRRKGYSTRAGGVEPFADPDRPWNPISQKKVDWADLIILLEERLLPILKKDYDIGGKKLISFTVIDAPKWIPDEFAELRKLPKGEFNKVWTYPRLRKAIKEYLPLERIK
jgi:predicted protein tyrosine phosphatase